MLDSLHSTHNDLFSTSKIEYVIQVRANDEEMHVQVEEKRTSTIWVNAFDRQSLEERTHRAGSFKKYNVFLKMFLSAITQQSESVFIDILSPHELELLKSMQANANRTP